MHNRMQEAMASNGMRIIAYNIFILSIAVPLHWDAHREAEVSGKKFEQQMCSQME